MLKTLHWYIGRDLASVASMALVAFTLVLTVFAIIEPLREQGLEADKVLSLIGFTMPVMLTLTLPIAALFAATIVYGRFSQDNELMACRASGLPMFRLLRPALVLGGIVTVLSLWLSSFVTPSLVESAARAFKDNVRGLVHSQMKADGYVKRGHRIVHVSRMLPDSDIAYGVVAIDFGKLDDIRILVASSAEIRFLPDPDGGGTKLAVSLENPMGSSSQSRATLYDESRLELPKDFTLPNPLREDPSWYRWERLFEVLEDPVQNRTIREELKQLQRRIAGQLLAEDIAAKLAETGRYERLVGDDRSVVLTAPKVAVRAGKAVLVAAADANGEPARVRAVVREPSKTRQIIADEATVESTWDRFREKSIVSIHFSGDLLVGEQTHGEDGQRIVWQENKLTESVGDLKVPAEILDEADDADLAGLLNEPEKYTHNQEIISRVQTIMAHDVRKLRGMILGEMHGRIAYSVSCFLMVVLGASLGMRFRGGQILSAFAICVPPAATVIILILMGRQMLANPDVDIQDGQVCLWSGVVLLGLADAYVAIRLLRQ